MNKYDSLTSDQVDKACRSIKTIRVIQQGNRFMAYFSDDKLLLPTPFSPRSRTQADVEKILQAKNPDYLVIS